MDSPLEEAEPDEENERDSREDQRSARGAPLSQEQIAAEMQVTRPCSTAPAWPTWSRSGRERDSRSLLFLPVFRTILS